MRISMSKQIKELQVENKRLEDLLYSERSESRGIRLGFESKCRKFNALQDACHSLAHAVTKLTSD